MSRQEANEQFLLTSFLDGANATYIEQLYAAYEDDPNAVSEEWRDFFKALGDDPDAVKRAAEGASWKRDNWPPKPADELTAALDGNWGDVERVVEKKITSKASASGTPLSGEEVLRATRDSVRAIMMIRAFRMRGHLHAHLDPLGLAGMADDDYNELSPKAYGFTEEDYDRPIFIDNVLGLEYATIREMVDILTRTYCSTLGVEFMHISNPEEKAWIQERIEGPEKSISFTENGKKAICRSWSRRKASRSFLTSSTRAPSVSVLMARNR